MNAAKLSDLVSIQLPPKKQKSISSVKHVFFGKSSNI